MFRSGLIALGIHLAMGESLGALIDKNHIVLAANGGGFLFGGNAVAAGDIGGGAAKVIGFLHSAGAAVGIAGAESGFHPQVSALRLQAFKVAVYLGLHKRGAAVRHAESGHILPAGLCGTAIFIASAFVAGLFFCAAYAALLGRAPGKADRPAGDFLFGLRGFGLGEERDRKGENEEINQLLHKEGRLDRLLRIVTIMMVEESEAGNE